MMRNRPLSETLIEIADGLVEMTTKVPIKTHSVELRLPFDIGFRESDGELTGGLPQFRMRTSFDPEPTWLEMVFGEIHYDD